MNTTAGREILRDGLAALGTLHGQDGIRADASRLQTPRPAAAATRECLGIFIFLENTRPRLETRGSRNGSPRSRPWHRYCLKKLAALSIEIKAARISKNFTSPPVIPRSSEAARFREAKRTATLLPVPFPDASVSARKHQRRRGEQSFSLCVRNFVECIPVYSYAPIGSGTRCILHS